MATAGNPAWKKGTSGNPKGRPKGSTGIKTQIQQQFIDMMATQVPVIGASGKQLKNKTETFFDAYNKSFMQSATDPKSPAFKFMAERLYGMDILADVDAQLNKSRREDTDFLTYRINKRAFDIQQRVLLSKSREIGLMCGRRAGKSELNRLKSVCQAQSEMNQRIVIIGLTVMKTLQIYWDETIKLLDELGFDYNSNKTETRIDFDNGSFIQFGGSSNTLEREKYRGNHWDLIIIDEAQSQRDLGVFVKEVINPMLLDTNGCLLMTGSGPRTRGTFWEQFYSNPADSGLRLNWNLSQNPYIYNFEQALEDEKTKYNLTDTDPLFMREYLGLIVYDDDALVYRMNSDNYATEDEIDLWVSKQSPEDIRFVAGLDYGFRDSDALAVIMYSEYANEKFLVYEYKKNGTDVTELVQAIQDAKLYVKNRFKSVYNTGFDIYADTSDQKIGLELTNRYNIPVFPAMKYDKTMAIQMLQQETKTRNLKVKENGIFYTEALRIIFKRKEQDGVPTIITREIDDDIYHPDLMDAILYSLRYYWLTHNPDHAVIKDETKPDIVPEIYKPEYKEDEIVYNIEDNQDDDYYTIADEQLF